MPVTPGSRHYRAGDRDPDGLGTGPWNCPACGTSQTTPMARGCLSCGAGTPEAAERAKAAGAASLVRPQDLQLMLCGAADLHTATAFPNLDRKARLTLAKALAHYAETGTPTNDELSRVFTLAWGRAVFAALGDEDGQ